MILGAVLAGGRSTRFGSDKALAELGGRTLLARAVEALAAHCEAVVVIGRETAPAPTIPDWPRADMGPLGGIAAALHHARDAGYAQVLTCSVDSVGLAGDLLTQLQPAPAYCESQPVIGLWPASASATLDAMLTSEGRHSMLAFATSIGARAVRFETIPDNINTPADLLAAEERSHGL
ncbi:MAG: molybdenum cofactor guanylyltransferase [Novosphingobium sp. 28-62-57]|uniref:molybdenum cofactor guanylyltransferase n=1 Tax=unclassified Novosphingobium TaxID=2644732 RepID=UPI000BDDC764|nr:MULTISPECIES: molybdenum cofactor guanylyltransferase [unclassified Novosphingobium]OYW48500.1 MAG: molybdenum cofactor guanylyltransferase [Novosphingobium sp. 12-62-10]OYZ09348.1 MAG: molybdenum cofactor guanylyltransferase [Novosphingobium sp. 28-62-57]OZA38639.1 MAG: molybdenum cofactor guanylyltransferase [Novosphingobium sp. 17-62-9]HQS69709.1 molybdenum cofactor guanylyltransferase [Novosphingobium sp.]